jgi:hypothetical protein
MASKDYRVRRAPSRPLGNPFPVDAGQFVQQVDILHRFFSSVIVIPPSLAFLAQTAQLDSDRLDLA